MKSRVFAVLLSCLMVLTFTGPAVQAASLQPMDDSECRNIFDVWGTPLRATVAYYGSYLPVNEGRLYIYKNSKRTDPTPDTFVVKRSTHYDAKTLYNARQGDWLYLELKRISGSRVCSGLYYVD